MSVRQLAALRALGTRSMTTVGLASALDTTVPAAQKILDALFRRSLVTITPLERWTATERGRKKVAA